MSDLDPPTVQPPDPTVERVTVNSWLSDVAKTTITMTFMGAGAGCYLDRMSLFTLACHHLILSALTIPHPIQPCTPVIGAFNPYPFYDIQPPKAALAGGRAYLPPFSSLKSIGYLSGVVGTVGFVQRFTAGFAALATGRHDLWNECVGVLSVWGYCHYYLFRSQGNVVWNNRAFAGFAVGSVIYANTGSIGQ